MRSLGRFIIEDKTGYVETLKQVGFPVNLIATIALKNTTIGLQPVDTKGSRKALAG